MKTPDILLRTHYMKARPAPSGLLAFGAVVTGSTRSSDGLDPRRRRLLYRSWHRGTREMDLIMGRFADTAIADLSPAELDEFERLSDVPDDALYSWITRGVAPADYDRGLFRRLCEFQCRRNER